jgi:ABC-type lipoprotein export system ATPase subunit
MRGQIMITLDAAQAFALGLAAKEAVQVAGLAGTGKSVLANAIALQASNGGQSCLLDRQQPHARAADRFPDTKSNASGSSGPRAIEQTKQRA